MAARNLAGDKYYSKIVLEALRGNMNWKQLFIADDLSPSEVMSIALGNEFSSICQPNHPFFAQELNSSAMMIGAKEKFLDFPIMSILNPSKVEPHSEKLHTILDVKFDRASQKSEVLESVKSSVKALRTSETLQSECLIVADEFFTNAVYNAPFVDDQNSKPGASRKDNETKMHEGNSARIFLGADEGRVVIGCTDPYGSLNPQKLFDRMKKCYDLGVGEMINMSESGGAGIGLFTVFNAASSLFIIVDKGVQTTIICTLPLKIKSRTRLELPKNLHYLVKK